MDGQGKSKIGITVPERRGTVFDERNKPEQYALLFVGNICQNRKHVLNITG